MSKIVYYKNNQTIEVLDLYNDYDVKEKPKFVTDFNFNFNFKNYDPETKTVPNEEGANWQQDLILKGTPNVRNGFINVSSSNYAYAEYDFGSTSANPFNRSGTDNMTIIYKLGNTTSNGTDLISNRGDSYNWMIRPRSTDSRVHYQNEVAYASYTQNAIKTLVVTVDDTTTTHRVIGGSSATSTYRYYGPSNKLRFFQGYSSSERFYGEVYWMFQANRLLTEEEIQTVIEYNEGLQGRSNNDVIFIPKKINKAYRGSNILIGDAYKPEPIPEVPSNEIWYTTNDGLTAQTTQMKGVASLNSMGLASNTYVDGKGIMKFSKDVTSIGERAFQQCTSLTSIILPNSATYLGISEFYHCDELRSVTLGNNIIGFDSYVFYYCSNLTDINYNGTKSQFASITKGYNWKYDVPTSCIVHCTDGNYPITDFD